MCRAHVSEAMPKSVKPLGIRLTGTCAVPMQACQGVVGKGVEGGIGVQRLSGIASAKRAALSGANVVANEGGGSEAGKDENHARSKVLSSSESAGIPHMQ